MNWKKPKDLIYGEMEIKIKMTKQLYKYWDSYNRYQIWIGKKMLKCLKVQYGMEKTKG